MRAMHWVGAGMGVLFLARVTIGCAGDQGQEPFDAGPGFDAAVGHDSGREAEHDGAVVGVDATVPIDDGGLAVDASHVDSGREASAASDGAADAPHADGDAPDTGDAGPPQDASDASIAIEASAADAGEDSSAGDSSVPEDAGADALVPIDAGAALDASDAAACVACGSPLTFLGNTAAFVGGAGTPVGLHGGTVPASGTVSAITQTYPQGAALSVHLVYATDAQFTTQVDAVMTFDKTAGNNDQWYFVLPAQPSGTTVYWYVDARSCDCTTTDYDPGNLQSFTYAQQ